MCGIAGFTGFKDNVELAAKANRVQQHRGPDNQSVWHDDHIAFAHQRLSIIDLSEAANQPLHKHQYAVIFNGEIYNYKELQAKLSSEKQVSFQTSSDTEVVLEMYKQYGPECLNYFLGMFAFAVYDKNSHDLFIARDHFGIKPLFYTQINGALAFSSELKTLVALPGFNKKINAKSLVSCLNYIWISGNETMFEGCYKLPPAHYMTFSKQAGIKMVKYWDIKDQAIKKSAADINSTADDVANTIELSVKRHMVADVPVSCFLSGGLDSSLISVLAKKSNEHLSTYTIGTEEKDKSVEKMPDDEKYADLLAKMHNFDHHVIKINPDVIQDLPHMVRHLDEPIGDPAAINTYLICKAAKEKGVKVLLSGMGADEIFFGYRRQKATLMAIRFNRLPKPIKFIIAKTVDLLPVKISGKGFKFGRWAKRFMSFATMPLNEAYMRSYSYYDTNQLKELMKPEFWNGIDAINKEHEQKFNEKFRNDPINQICNTDISMFMLGLNLTYSDRASMAASVEVRVPFIDRLVVSKAMEIPGDLKIRKGISKFILKKAAEKWLPEKIIYRPKASFGAPIRSWISNDLRVMVDELLSEEAVNKRGFVNYSVVKKLITDDRNGSADNAYQIYQLLTLELWCREFLDAHAGYQTLNGPINEKQQYVS
ncbi:MAG TPA: asparagine synthase (glutamine-hydrolyzing) [Ferruginibacter sp.]|nr:asparagine synthase (glutamine-hydrolyzing) [Ferruginibacter sp.]